MIFIFVGVSKDWPKFGEKSGAVSDDGCSIDKFVLI